MDNLYVYKVGNYQISRFFIEGYPCKHSLRVSNSDEWKRLSGVEIYKILKSQDLSHPHFEYFCNFFSSSSFFNFNS